jgi:translation initiation factor IF-2
MEDNNQKNQQNMVNRPPVVVILGHVDSGKTSLLLAIRKMQFTEAKPGGAITQHIGAYQVEKDGKKITFLDTPGHEAFSAMRSRGAKVADIAILVVDGLEGVKPQTKEAILNIKGADIPFIVAINKVDRQEVIPEKIKTQLMRENVLVESMGGKIPSVNVSAKTGQGITELLDTILILGEVEGLKGDISKPAQGIVIESFLDSRRGPLATLILSEGILKIGDAVGTPSVAGKVKSLENFKGEQIENAFPSDPVVITGFPSVPKVGEILKVFPDSQTAENNIEVKEKKDIFQKAEVKDGQVALNIILKSDVEGSIEAIYQIVKGIPQEKVVLNILEAKVGEVSESDVKMARSTKAVIFGFRVKISPVARQMAERDKIRIFNFEIIYDLVEGIRKSMERILSPEDVRTDTGRLKILGVFLDEKNRQIIGGRVVYGEVKKGTQIDVSRNEEIVGKGKIINLQKNKKDADRVSKGEECGILFEGNVKVEIGDILLFYTQAKVKGEL